MWQKVRTAAFIVWLAKIYPAVWLPVNTELFRMETLHNSSKLTSSQAPNDGMLQQLP